MSDFGDKDVLDVWDDVDVFEVKLRILERIVVELQAVPNENRRLEALRLLLKLLRAREDLHARLERLREALNG